MAREGESFERVMEVLAAVVRTRVQVLAVVVKTPAFGGQGGAGEAVMLDVVGRSVVVCQEGGRWEMLGTPGLKPENEETALQLPERHGQCQHCWSLTHAQGPIVLAVRGAVWVSLSV